MKTENQDHFIAREITIILRGETKKIRVGENQSILDAGLELGLDMPFSCQSGYCSACMGKCQSGEITMTEDKGLSNSEFKDNFVLLCTAHPISDNVVIEIDD